MINKNVYKDARKEHYFNNGEQGFYHPHIINLHNLNIKIEANSRDL